MRAAEILTVKPNVHLERGAHAVDQHQHLVCVRAAQEQRGLLARAAGAIQIDTGFETQ